MTLTKDALISEVAKENGYLRSQSAGIIETLIELIKSKLVSGEDVLISGFGKFCVKEKRQRRGRNPATGKDMMLEARIVSFGNQFDPQLFHTDPEGAKSTMYGGLIASGWHTASLMMRECVRHYLPRAASLGSPGVDELRWNLPVRPGDTLSVRVTILEATRSRSKPDRGIVQSLFEVLNQEWIKGAFEKAI
jgi:acyl dehydratase